MNLIFAIEFSSSTKKLNFFLYLIRKIKLLLYFLRFFLHKTKIIYIFFCLIFLYIKDLLLNTKYKVSNIYLYLINFKSKIFCVFLYPIT